VYKVIGGMIYRRVCPRKITRVVMLSKLKTRPTRWAESWIDVALRTACECAELTRVQNLDRHVHCLIERVMVRPSLNLVQEVNQRRTRLVLGWVTVCRRVNHLGM